MPSASDARLFRIGGICGIAGTLVVLVVVPLAALTSSWFRWDRNALSEMGVHGEAPVFNGAVIVGGLLSVVFGLALWRLLPGRKVAPGILLVILGSTCLALVGVFTLATPVAHGLAALGFFVATPSGLLVLGFEWVEGGRLRLLSFVCGGGALLAILVLSVPLTMAGVGFAVPELVHALLLGIWTSVVGATMVRRGLAVVPA